MSKSNNSIKSFELTNNLKNKIQNTNKNKILVIYITDV
jgi:hypothetical protein